MQLVVNAPADDAIALVDEAELERALLNLVLNAGDAMPRGGTLTITWRGEDVTGGPHGLADGRYVSLSVSDTGEGMDRETLDRIFDPFFTTKGDKGGTGLGLATVYAFAKESHGAIECGVNAWRRDNLHAAAARIRRRRSRPRAASIAQPTSAGVARAADESSSSRIGRTCARAWRESCRTTASTSAKPATATAPCACCPTAQTFALMCIDGVMPGLETAAVIERARDLAPVDAGAGVLGSRAGGVAAPRDRDRPLCVPVETLFGATAAGERRPGARLDRRHRW